MTTNAGDSGLQGLADRADLLARLGLWMDEQRFDDAATIFTSDATVHTKAGVRLLSHTAIYAERLVNEGLAGAAARKWHYAVLVALQESGPASQATLSRRAGIYRSDLVAVINELADRGHVAYVSRIRFRTCRFFSFPAGRAGWRDCRGGRRVRADPLR
jgi:hypothetical protein